MSAPVFSAADFLHALQSLLPRGAVWSRDPDAVQTQTLLGLVQANAHVVARANNLLAESNPITAVELLPEWESSVGLPDPAIGQLPTLLARRGLVVSKISNYGGQSAAYFINQAAQLGYSIAIQNNASFRAGQSSAGQSLGSQDWFFVWTINSPLNALHPFRAGQSLVGEPLNSWDNLLLGIRLGEIKPAHSILNFNYQ